MFNLKQLLLALRRHITQVSWPALIALLVLHSVCTSILLSLAGETALTANDNFFYYYVVTTSTVGFGDFSPSTEAGKLIVSSFQIPFGLALFGAFLGKIGQTITLLLRRHMTGDNDFQKLQEHIIIFGWHAHRTGKIIDHILGDVNRKQRTILLCVQQEIEHPFADNPSVLFLRINSFTDVKDLNRAGIATADRVIIDGRDDNQTFTTALRISKLVKGNCHISCYFDDENKVQMIHEHCSNVECSVAWTAEMLVRSIQDPGAARIQEEMLSTLRGDTQFSIEVPDDFDAQGVPFLTLFTAFKKSYNATILGIANDRAGNGMDLNPDNDYRIKKGQFIHYIAQQRLLSQDISWNSLT